jgi:hypothetical protein
MTNEIDAFSANEANEDDTFNIRFKDTKNPGREEVPLSILTQVTAEMQHIVYLLAMQAEGKIVNQRARLDAEIEKKYTLLCSPIQAGSVIIPVYLTPVQASTSKQSEVSGLFKEVSKCVAENNVEGFYRLIPDHSTRTRILTAYQDMIPKSTWSYSVSISTGKFEPLKLDLTDKIRKNIDSFRTKYTDSVNIQTVTGRLLSINFNDNKIKIHYPVTNRELECSYHIGREEILKENARDWIHVTGNVILDENDNPKSITEVMDIVPLDLSPITLEKFEDEESQRILTFKEPIVLQPNQDESRQLILLQEDSLGLYVFGATRDELENALHGMLWVLWDEYAKEEDKNLGVAARKIKEQWLSQVEELSVATG